MFKAIPLFSGSSGNCVYLKYNNEEILIDAGVSYKRICMALREIGTDISNIKALLVTHEHIDHVKAIDVLSRNTSMPIYINSFSASAYDVPYDDLFSHHAIIKNQGESILFSGFETQIFKTPHDSLGSVGYRFNFSDGTSFGIATDIGEITDEVSSHLLGCDSVIIESNHDIGMLKKGPYPYSLKQRILSKHGHLSNDACAGFLPKLAENGTKKIVLAHLSEENNTPETCFTTCATSLKQAGYTSDQIRLTVAMRSITNI